MAAESAGDDGFDDYTLATPWERLVASLEEALSGWQAAGPAALAAQCEPASDADALRCVTVTVPVPFFLPTHTQAYLLRLHFPPGPREGAEWSEEGHEGPFPLGAHAVTRSFGHRAFVLLSGCGGAPVRDEDEACALASALRCAATAVQAPWPVLLRCGDAQRCALRGGVTRAGVVTRMETEALQATRPARWAAQPGALLTLLQTRVAACGGGGDESLRPGAWAASVDASFSLRCHYPLPPAQTEVQAGDSGVDSESESESERDAQAFGGEQQRSRRRAFGLLLDREWDAGAPWSPWLTLQAPFGAQLQMAATWRGVGAEELPDGCEDAAPPAHDTAPLHPRTAHCWTIRASLSARGDGDGDDAEPLATPVGRAEGGLRQPGTMGHMLHAMAATLRSVCGCEATGSLVSGDFWEAKGEGSPSVPPEGIVQDVLRDIFDAPRLPTALGGLGGIRLQGGRSSAAVGACSSPPLPRTCPPDSLLARIALHALSFGNARAVAQLWQRVLRELRFSYWDAGVGLPRMGACGPCSPDSVPDVSQCLLSQKLQLLDICIARRADEAACGARDAAEAVESGEAARTEAVAAAQACAARRRAAAAAEVSAGWDREWSDEDGWQDVQPQAGATGAAGGDDDDGFATASEGEGDDAAANGEMQVDATSSAAQVVPPAVGAPRGVSAPLPFRLLAWPHMRAHAPRTLRPPALTEDALRERELALAALGSAAEGAAAARAKLQAGPLLSDMCAFKAANLQQGGGQLADFVRWHSPKDWLEEEEVAAAAAAAAAQETGGPPQRSGDARAPRGRLSERMAQPEGVWAQLWRSAQPRTAAEQKPLQDACTTGEATLHWLEVLSPADVFAGLLACGGGAVVALLSQCDGMCLPSARAELAGARATCEAVLARPCPFAEEWRAMCEAVEHAEQVSGRAEWLTRSLPAAPAAAEALLAASLRCGSEGDAAEAELAVGAEKEALVDAALAAVAAGAQPALRELLLSAHTQVRGCRLRHRLYARVEAGHAALAISLQSPDE